jgi:hypothetical protein
MLEVAGEWTVAGWIVLMPFVDKYTGKAPTDHVKRMLDDMHYTKISMSERIIVVGSHRGESTLNEMDYATEHGIPIFYRSP